MTHKNITIKELRDSLDKCVKAGLGDLQIVISDDNEGKLTVLQK